MELFLPLHSGGCIGHETRPDFQCIFIHIEGGGVKPVGAMVVPFFRVRPSPTGRNIRALRWRSS